MNARWNLRPAAEREIAAERRSAVVRRRLGWTAFLAAFWLCPLSCLSLIPVAGGPLGTGVAVFALALQAGLMFEWARRTAHDDERRRAQHLRLAQESEATEGWPVLLTLFQGAAPTGQDPGIVWTEDDRLYFVGSRTSFGLAADDARRAVREARTIDGLRAGLTVDLKTGGSLGFDVLTVGEPPALVREQLSWELRRWRSRTGPAPDEALEPLPGAGPDAPSARLLLVRALGASAFWGGAGAAALLLAPTLLPVLAAEPFFAAFLVFVMLGIAWAALSLLPEVWAPGLRWRAWRDRRTLDRGASTRRRLG